MLGNELPPAGFHNPERKRIDVGRLDHKKTARLEPRNGELQHARIVFLIHIVKDDVQRSGLFFRQYLQRIAHPHVDSPGNPGFVEIPARLFGILKTAVGVDDASRVAYSHRPPDGGVSDG